MPQIIPTAEPFLFPGSRTGCLLVHGFTGSPKEMRWMGEYMSAQGFSVLGVRLAGHATRIEDMRRSRWTDWVASVEDGYHLLCGLTDRIYLVGLSMGGALALLMSTRLNVKGVVAISTPWRVALASMAKYIRPLTLIWPYAAKSREPAGSTWFDKEAFKDHVSYDRNPIASAVEFDKLIAEMRLSVPEIRVPAFLIQSENDPTVRPSDMEHIYSALVSAPQKDKLLIKNSGHVVTRDAARAEVFEAAAQFISRLESGPK